MIRTRIGWTVMVLAAMLLAAPTARGAKAVKGEGTRLAEKFREVVARLDLDKEQAEKVDAIVATFREKFIKLQGEAESRDELKSKGRALLQETREEVRKVLTPAQDKKLRELMTERKGEGKVAGEKRGKKGKKSAATEPADTTST